MEELLVLAELDDELSSMTQQSTVLALSNDRFNVFDVDPDLLEDQVFVTRLMRHHVIGTPLTTANIFGLSQLTTLCGQLPVDGAARTIGTANVLVPDVQSANGYLHVIGLAQEPPETC
jgi:uncharacterized surface protein with fasciclin (FAS1) repeats